MRAGLVQVPHLHRVVPQEAAAKKGVDRPQCPAYRAFSGLAAVGDGERMHWICQLIVPTVAVSGEHLVISDKAAKYRV